MERDMAFCISAHTMGISTHTLTWSVTHDSDNYGLFTQNFNSHAHVERDKMFKKFYQTPENFNSHAHVERDQQRGACKGGGIYFNSHAHVERDV